MHDDQLQWPAESALKGVAVPTIRIDSWAQFRSMIDGGAFRSWGFRGQTHADWGLWTAISRHLRYAGVHPAAWARQEERILRVFRRKAHLWVDPQPAENNSFEWLALMQHHGAPTRLLDMTWSPYVALFFALDRGGPTSAVWAFDVARINQMPVTLRDGRTVEVAPASIREEGSFERHFLRQSVPFVIVGEPHAMHRRLIAQSSTFLVPSVLDRSIEAILAGYAGEPLVTRFELETAAMRAEALQALYLMNITAASLFPDLDGLGRSLAYELEWHWAFDPRTLEARPGFAPPTGLWEG
ncbi:MAG: FRG domain-containing protein [Gemmatimonadaceae bacterium]|jgi:hypothetical protein|nr:FRG domain-containing protein [Gemmatimonadaceae bacterium]